MANSPKGVALMKNLDKDFLEIFGTASFVDKTRFISSVYVPGRRFLFTAPSRFGKSMNLYMLKDFFCNRPKNTTTTEYENMEIYQDQEFFKQNFRTHPVLFFDFKATKKFAAVKYTDVMDVFRYAIQNVFIEQHYLLSNPDVIELAKNMILSWCRGDDKIFAQNEETIIKDIRNLVRTLKLVNNKAVIVLIDNYDGILNDALYEKKMLNDDFRQIIKFTSMIVNNLCNHTDVSISVVTGVSLLLTRDHLNITGFSVYPFLIDHEFFGFFGFTEKELDTLLQTVTYSEDKIIHKEKIKLFFGGFFSLGGAQLYNPHSVMKCLMNIDYTSYWSINSEVSAMVKCIMYPTGAKIIDTLLKKMVVRKPIRTEVFSITEILHLKILFGREGMDPASIVLWLPFLFDLGLVSYSDEVPRIVEEPNGNRQELVKLPNEETYSLTLIQFLKVVISFCDLPPRYFSVSNYSEFVEAMKETKNKRWMALFGLKMESNDTEASSIGPAS